MLLEAAASGFMDRVKYSGPLPNGQTVTQQLFSQAVADNIQVIRAFGHGATPAFTLQTAPGELSWRCLQTTHVHITLRVDHSAEAEAVCSQVNTMKKPSEPWTKS